MMFSQAILFMLPVSLVLALEKVTFLGLPVYFLEALFLIFVVLNIAKICWEKLESRWKGFDRWVALGGALFIVGAAVATLGQSQIASLTSLGQLKSWVFFPALLVLVLYSLQEGKQKERELFYAGWLLGVAIIALTALYGYSFGALTYDGRLAFPYNSPNFLALLVTPGLFLIIFFLYQIGTLPKKILTFSTAGVFLVVLYLTHSYNAWLSLILAILVIIVMLWMQRVDDKHYYKLRSLFIGGVLLLTILFSLEQGSNKWEGLLNENGRSSLDSRVMIWQSAGMILRDHWFLGIGVGNFQQEYLAYQAHFTPYLEWAVPQPHNLVLAVWLQTGLIGLAGFVILVSRLMGRLYKSTKTRKSNEGVLLLSLWLVFLFYGLIDTPYFRNDLAFLFWLQVLLTYWYVEEKELT
jgi:O-antigen ligase